MFARTWILIAGFLLCSQAAIAQIPVTSTCPASAPVSVRAVPVKPGDTTALAIIKNIGTRQISAVFLSWEFTDAKGGGSSEVTTLDLAATGEFLNPDERTIDESAHLPQNISITAATVGCAGVVFSDGIIGAEETCRKFKIS